jgi:hypothetical protein
MRLAAAMIVASSSLLWTACSLADPARSTNIEPGKTFSLRVGESVRSDDGALLIGFLGVPADSRCPKGAQCIWAGGATVRVWLQQAGGSRLTRELHTASNAPQVEKVPGIALRLVRLDPHPITGKAIPQGDYVATLALDRDASAPER